MERVNDPLTDEGALFELQLAGIAFHAAEMKLTAAIKDARATGIPIRRIAEVVGIPPTTVYRRSQG